MFLSENIISTSIIQCHKAYETGVTRVTPIGFSHFNVDVLEEYQVLDTKTVVDTNLLNLKF